MTKTSKSNPIKNCQFDREKTSIVYSSSVSLFLVIKSSSAWFDLFRTWPHYKDSLKTISTKIEDKNSLSVVRTLIQLYVPLTL